MRASESERALACPASLHLPREETRSEAAITAAEYGTAVHLWKETGEIPDGPIGRLLEEKLLLSGTDRQKVWAGFEHEVTFSLAPGGAVNRFIGSRERADEWKREEFQDGALVTGTIDSILCRGVSVVIDDLKTGRFPPDPDNWAQGLTYAILPYADGAESFQFRITHWPKYPKAAPPAIYLSRWYGRERIAAHIEALKSAIAADDERPGEHCRFCPSQGACETFQLLH